MSGEILREMYGTQKKGWRISGKDNEKNKEETSRQIGGGQFVGTLGFPSGSPKRAGKKMRRVFRMRMEKGGEEGERSLDRCGRL